MNDKVLAEGKFPSWDVVAKLCFYVAGTSIVACFLVACIFGEGDPLWAFKGMHYGYYWFFIGAAVFVVLGLLLSGRPMGCRLIVKQSSVTGVTLFGKKVNLPLSQISAIGTGLFNRITIATAPGRIHFYGVSNKEEIYTCLSGLLADTQKATQVNSSNSPVSSLDDLAKLKEFLEQGVLTQEEFDAKKKQILKL